MKKLLSIIMWITMTFGAFAGAQPEEPAPANDSPKELSQPNEEAEPEIPQMELEQAIKLWEETIKDPENAPEVYLNFQIVLQAIESTGPESELMESLVAEQSGIDGLTLNEFMDLQTGFDFLFDPKAIQEVQMDILLREGPPYMEEFLDTQNIGYALDYYHEMAPELSQQEQVEMQGQLLSELSRWNYFSQSGEGKNWIGEIYEILVGSPIFEEVNEYVFQVPNQPLIENFGWDRVVPVLLLKAYWHDQKGMVEQRKEVLDLILRIHQEEITQGSSSYNTPRAIPGLILLAQYAYFQGDEALRDNALEMASSLIEMIQDGSTQIRVGTRFAKEAYLLGNQDIAQNWYTMMDSVYKLRSMDFYLEQIFQMLEMYSGMNRLDELKKMLEQLRNNGLAGRQMDQVDLSKLAIKLALMDQVELSYEVLSSVGIFRAGSFNPYLEEYLYALNQSNALKILPEEFWFQLASGSNQAKEFFQSMQGDPMRFRPQNTLVIWTQEGEADGAYQFVEKLIEDFIELKRNQYPDLEILLKNKETETLREDFITSTLAGVGPDLIWTVTDHVAALAPQQLLIPLDSIIDFNRFMESANASVEYKGTHYGAPITNGDHLMLYYNKALLEQAPESTDEMIQIAPSLLNKGVYPLVFNQDEPFWLIPWLGGFGGEVFEEDGVTPNLNNPEMIKALRFLQDIKYEHELLPRESDYAASETLFLQGKAAMLINGDWVFDEYYNAFGENLGVARIPRVSATGAYPAPYISGKAILLSTALENNPERLEILLEFIEFVLQRENQMDLMRMLSRFPSILSVYNEPLSDEPIRNTLLYASFQQLQQGVPMPGNPEMRYNWDAMRSPFIDVMKGRLEPEDAARRMQENAETMMEYR